MSNFSEALEKFRKGRGLAKQDLAERAGLTASYISHLTRGSRTTPSQETVVKLAEALKLEDEEKKYLFHSAGLSLPSASLPIISSTVIHHDGQPGTTTEIWGEAPNTQDVYGREDELRLLRRWVLDDRCQLVVISGVGGIGKTLTATRLARDITGEFNYVFWHSLKDTPSLESTLKNFFTLFSGQPQFTMPLGADDQMRLFMRNLQEQRCLLILDNLES